MQDPRLVELGINVVRGLAMDAPRQASSGHSGTAMALAPLAHVLWTRVMRHDPLDPAWPDRDRFVLSCGHACILQYAFLHLTGYDLTLDDLRRFRQWGSRTPGHPEFGHTAGRRGDHRPAGAGLRQRGRHGPRRARGASPLRGRGVRPPRLRSGERRLHHGGRLPRGGIARRAPRPGPPARRLRRQPHHHRRPDRAGLRRRPGEDGSRPTAGGCGTWARSPTTSTSWRRRCARRSNHPADGPDARPNLLVLRSHIGWPSPELTDTADAHGTPFPPEEIRATKEILGLPPDETFWVPDEVREFYAQQIARGARDHAAWVERFTAWDGDRAAWDAAHDGRGLPGWSDGLPRYDAGTALATRRALNQSIDATAAHLPGLVAGSADLTGNNGVKVKGARDAVRRVPGRDPGPLRHPRARHGLRHDRHGAARWRAPARWDVLRVLRLHAAGGPPGRAHRGPRPLLVDPRLGGPGRGRPDAPAGRAPGVAARHARAWPSCARPTPTRRRRRGGPRSRRPARWA